MHNAVNLRILSGGMIVSIIFHALFFWALPPVDISFRNPDTVEVAIIEKPKEKVRPPAARRGAATTRPGTAVEAPAVAVPPPAPAVELPESLSTDTVPVAAPELMVDDLPVYDPAAKEEALIAELDAEAKRVREQAANPRPGLPEAGKASVNEQGFFTIENLTNSRRSLVSRPDKPDFALTANTKVRLAFIINPDGSVTGVRLLTRTDSSIEKIAVDFVRGLKFTASARNETESGEITITFTVR